MEPIFDRQGALAGWLHENRVMDRALKHRAFLSGPSVVGYDSRPRGEFRDGWFWDASGSAVAFVPGAKNGPPAPKPTMPLLLPVPPAAPRAPAAPRPPAAPLRRPDWSATSFDKFLS